MLASISRESIRNTIVHCVHHVISAGRRILKLESNVEIFIYFFCFLLDRKEEQIDEQVLYKTVSIKKYCVL